MMRYVLFLFCTINLHAANQQEVVIKWLAAYQKRLGDYAEQIGYPAQQASVEEKEYEAKIFEYVYLDENGENKRGDWRMLSQDGLLSYYSAITPERVLGCPCGRSEDERMSGAMLVSYKNSNRVVGNNDSALSFLHKKNIGALANQKARELREKSVH
ncbi:MAG TPA: hypothetical protein VGT41_06300 [Candidatus Babeliales bacterium]|nr:hypothetical protein [Candidatus Babeliales bacterium]